MIKKELIEQVIEKEILIADKQNEYKSLYDTFLEDNSGLLGEIAEYKSLISELKAEITEQGKEEFIATGNKKLLGGVGIRVGSKINYDPKEAFNWAKEHNLCLSLDNKEFEKIAKTQNLDFVSTEDKITVTFPKNLSI